MKQKNAQQVDKTLCRWVIQEAESHKKIDEDGAVLRLNPNVTVFLPLVCYNEYVAGSSLYPDVI